MTGCTTGGAPTRVFIVDDHALVRDGLRQILGTTLDLLVVGEAGDQESALRLIARERPDVVLLDVEIPGGDVRETVSLIRSASPTTHVVILSIFDDAELVRSLVELGIRGYLLKSVGSRELIGAVRDARGDHDRVFLSVSRESLLGLTFGRMLLSERELEVLRLTAKAMSNAQIGAQLFLAEATVKKHLRSVFTKLRAVSRIDAVNKAVAAGILPAPD